jgi:hypothetical protein
MLRPTMGSDFGADSASGGLGTTATGGGLGTTAAASTQWRRAVAWRDGGNLGTDKAWVMAGAWREQRRRVRS